MISNKETKDKNIKKYIFEIVYIAIFVAISVFVGLHHEHWADEAQSWLIARDNDIIGIFKAIRYEGTPALWQLLLKFCIVLGLQYNQLYILTTLLTVIGIIFLHKNENVPLLFKILLPYTYYIFFQYTIVARSYNLLFPILMAIVYIYPNKKEHLLKYGILLFLLMNTSLYGFLIAGGFWSEFLVEELMRNKEKKQKMKNNLKIFFAVLTVLFISVIICVFPTNDVGGGIGVKNIWFIVLSNSLFTSSSNIFTNIIGVILFLIIYWRLLKTKDPNIVFRTLVLSIFNFMWIIFVVGKAWHIGIIFLIILTIAIINNKLKTDRIIYILLMASIIIQIYWSMSASIKDIKSLYASGEVVSRYLKEIGIEDKEIIGIDFFSVQLNPYFDKNLYKNYNKSYYIWSIKDDNKKISSKDVVENNIELDSDIIIVPFYYYYNYTTSEQKLANNSTLYQIDIINKIEATEKYDKKEFYSEMIFKNRKKESTSLIVYSKK